MLIHLIYVSILQFGLCFYSNDTQHIWRGIQLPAGRVNICYFESCNIVLRQVVRYEAGM